MSRHALVTGAGTGIGAEITRHLHAAGHRVTLVGRRPEPLQQLADALGDNSQVVSADVTDPDNLKNAFATAEAGFNGIEILVNCAGMAPTAPFHRIAFDDWQRTMDVNVNGVFHCTQLALAGCARPAGVESSILPAWRPCGASPTLRATARPSTPCWA